MRGGLAVREVEVPVDAGQQTARRSILPPIRSLIGPVRWSLPLVGLLGYMFVTTTYVVPVADIAIGLAIFGVLAQGRMPRIPLPMVLLLGFVFWGVLGMTQSTWPVVVWEAVYLMIKVSVIGIVVVNALRTPAQVRFFLMFWLACFAFYPARGAIFNYIGGYTVWGRALWNHAFANPNDLAAMTVLMLAIAASFAIAERNKLVRLAAYTAVGTLLLLIFLTQSRGAILALGVFALGAFVLATKAQRRNLLKISPVLAALLIYVAPDSVWERLGGLKHLGSSSTELKAVDKEGSAFQRFEIARVAAAVARENAVLGVGLGAYEHAHGLRSRSSEFDPFARGERDAHNTYLRVAAETGVPGLVLFLGVVGATLVYADRIRRRIRGIEPQTAMQLGYLELGLVTFMLVGLFGSLALIAYLYVYMMATWSFAHVLDTRSRGLRAT